MENLENKLRYLSAFRHKLIYNIEPLPALLVSFVNVALQVNNSNVFRCF